MNNLNNLHSADGSILGFLYQIERALMWLSTSSSETEVGVEVDDDITVKLIEGQDITNIYEQAKHSQTTKVPFSNSSVDLWKTLSIWVEAIQSGRLKVENAIFSLLTNKKMPQDRLAITLSNAKAKDKVVMATVLTDLKTRASKLPKSMEDFATIILNCPDAVLEKIIDKITVLDNTFTHNSTELKKKLKDNLSASEDLPFNYIYRSLFGFVSETLIDKWRNREPGWISVKAFNQQYSQLVADFKKKSFYEQTVDSLPIDLQDVENNKGKVYVEQLHKIGCDEEEVIEAIHDFIRAASERSRLAEDGEISKQKFELYYDDLLNYWKSISKPKFRFAQKGAFAQVGYEVYYTCIAYKGKINNYEPEQGYTHKGTYHYLSDQIKLGWHPEWESIKKKKKNDK
ncbi:ABC-three component system protein [Mucilaginibacter antarcticus]|uniref:ABC-three component system protein n=1 Tax=Mucilaginibacter antarcticus TaxID=1855725 RepID=A0ABW5XVB3_9SPHI